MKSNYFQNVKQKIKSISLKNKILKENRYIYEYKDSSEKMQKNEEILMRNKMLTTFYNLIYFYIKYDGKRKATECVPEYPQRISNYVVNCIHLNLEDIHKQEGLNVRFAIWWNHTLSTTTIYFKPQIPFELLRFIENNITDSKKELFEFYNSFCKWIVNSELSDDYLQQRKRLIIEAV